MKSREEFLNSLKYTIENKSIDEFREPDITDRIKLDEKSIKKYIEKYQVFLEGKTDLGKAYNNVVEGDEERE